MIDFAHLQLCDTDLWNLNETWYTEVPNLSLCFRSTVLVWPPFCLLIGLIAHEYLRYAKLEAKKVPAIDWNFFNISRLVLAIALSLFALSRSVANYYEFTEVDRLIRAGLHFGSRPALSTLLAPTLQALGFLCLIGIYCMHRRSGRHTCAGTWFFLLLSLIGKTVELYSKSVGFGRGSASCNSVELVELLLTLLLFLLECRGDQVAATSGSGGHLAPAPGEARKESPELGASFCSSILFSWYTDFLWSGYRSPLTTADLWTGSERFRVDKLAANFQRAWRRSNRAGATRFYQSASGEAQPINGCFYVIYRLVRWRMLSAASLKFLHDLLQFLVPLLLKSLLEFIADHSADNQQPPEWHGILFALLMLAVPTLRTLLHGSHLVRVEAIALEVRSTLAAAVYRKSMQLSSSSRLQATSGEIINLMSVDSNKFYECLVNINMLWSAPLQVIISVLLLYHELGWSVMAGIAFMLLLIPVNLYITNQNKLAQQRIMQTKDERIKQMNETVSGIKVIKLYAWENSFLNLLGSFRDKELGLLRRLLNLSAVSNFIWQCMPFMVALATFAFYILTDDNNILSAEKAFVSLSLFELLKYPLMFLPSFFTNFITVLVSAKRLNRFLNSDELIRYVSRNEHPLEAISIEGGTVAWCKEGSQSQGQPAEARLEEETKSSIILKDINIRIKHNTFVAIIGQVASGKSSLLSSILGEMHPIAGRFNICGSKSIAYVPQQAWIQNMSVRDNILFGLPFEEKKYRNILRVCALEADLAILPGGDQAEIGEKGINLSGGQKQRVSLARACYSNSDLFLFDDPLSALDSHVAKHLFNEVLSSSTGILKGKTRVLVTNSLFVLPFVDEIIVLDKGRIAESGTYKQLLANKGGYLRDMMIRFSGGQSDSDSNSSEQRKQEDQTTKLAAVNMMLPSVEAGDSQDRDRALAKDADRGRLVESETLETGSVDYHVYWAYVVAFSKGLMVVTVLAQSFSSALDALRNIWLADWTSDSESGRLECLAGYQCNSQALRLIRLLVFAGLGAAQCSVVLLCALVLSLGAVRASKKLHQDLLGKILHSPMAFFDTTPIGRIVNRFAKDIDVIDTALPATIRSCLDCGIPILTTIILICSSFPSFLAIMIPLFVCFLLVQRVFIVTTRQLKRLESITRSPIYSHFNETLSGMSTIRAYNSSDRFIRLSDNLIDRNQSCQYPNIIAYRWLAIRLESMANAVTMCVALLAVYYRESMGAGAAGLLITYTLSVSAALAWLIRMTSDLETDIVSVERILEYVKNEQEDSWIKELRPSPSWPNEGAIQIKDYSTRYRADTDLVLRNVSIDIRPGEKIGIVGRTGSGKSSLSLSLFRLLEPASGKILIDRLDIINYGLHDIRSKLTIIPQDPVLFSGTLRFNLDPLQLYSDLEIWRALELANLKAYISSLKFALDHRVTEFGENFSVGQRQLICLARAILRKSKILILDEATASVDVETDSIVQRTIRDIFSDCTIITIAHRLHTILDSDRILVLDGGVVKELDSPENLIKNQESSFYSLVRDAGIDPGSVLKVSVSKRS